jgi:hypothetical protein
MAAHQAAPVALSSVPERKADRSLRPAARIGGNKRRVPGQADYDPAEENVTSLRGE